MDKNASLPPKPLGRSIFQGCAVSSVSLRIAYSVHEKIGPSTGVPEDLEIRVGDIEGSCGTSILVDKKVVYRTRNGRCPEPQVLRHVHSKIIFAEYVSRFPRCNSLDWQTVVKGIEVVSGVVRTYIGEHLTHNEPEGIFPPGEHICLDSSCDFGNYWRPIDPWKLKLDGTSRGVRMTRAIEHSPWRCSSSNVSPDGRWLAFMVNTRRDGSGAGSGLGLFELEKLDQSGPAQAWQSRTRDTTRCSRIAGSSSEGYPAGRGPATSRRPAPSECRPPAG